MNMNFLDVILGIPLMWAIYKGFTKGFIIEAASLAGLILGFYFAVKFSSFSSDFFKNIIGFHGRYLSIIAFATTFLLVLAIIYLLGKVLEKAIEMVSLGIFNRLAGIAFSVAKTAFILSVLLFLINRLDPYQKLLKPEHKQKSILYFPVESFAPRILPGLKSGSFSIPPPGKEKQEAKYVPSK